MSSKLEHGVAMRSHWRPCHDNMTSFRRHIDPERYLIVNIFAVQILHLKHLPVEIRFKKVEVKDL